MRNRGTKTPVLHDLVRMVKSFFMSDYMKGKKNNLQHQDNYQAVLNEHSATF